MTHPSPPPQWQPPQPPTPHTAPKTPFWRSRKGAAVLLGVGLLAAVIVAGNSSGEKPTTQTPPGAASGAAETWTSPAGRQPRTVEAAAPAPSGPLTSFADGTYEVGTGDGQIAPGKYRSSGPADGPTGLCYWARLKHNDGGLDDIIANNVGHGQSLINVAASDGYLEVRGCRFTKAG